jgi:hypothetical protein
MWKAWTVHCRSNSAFAVIAGDRVAIDRFAIDEVGIERGAIDRLTIDQAAVSATAALRRCVQYGRSFFLLRVLC